jgi:putative DNA primase/helicase
MFIAKLLAPPGASSVEPAALLATAANGTGTSITPRETDYGNALRLVADHGSRIRYVQAWRTWLVYDGTRWEKDATGQVMRYAKASICGIYTQAAGGPDSGRKALVTHALRSEAENRLCAMVALARSEPSVAIRPEQLDADPWLLNVNNGTLDLRTGALRDHDPNDLTTKLAPVVYDPEAECPLWLSALDRIFAGRQTVIEFFQRYIGYALTGDTREHVMAIGHGRGRNGKTTLLNAVQDVLGDYAEQAPASMLLVKDVNAIPNDVARLHGVRFVVAAESAEGRRLDEALVKQLTGGDRVTARFMKAEWFTFRPTFKLWLSTNHRPEVRGTDRAIWSRIKLIPFTVTIPDEEQDKRLGDKLRAEAAGILRWAVEGCLAWQRDGLGAADEVREATEAYRADMDVLGAFLAEQCVLDVSARTTSAKLYEAYTTWAQQAGEKAVSKKLFGQQLAERDLKGGRKSGARGWEGIRLRSLTDSDVDSAATHDGQGLCG